MIGPVIVAPLLRSGGGKSDPARCSRTGRGTLNYATQEFPRGYEQPGSVENQHSLQSHLRVAGSSRMVPKASS